MEGRSAFQSLGVGKLLEKQEAEKWRLDESRKAKDWEFFIALRS